MTLVMMFSPSQMTLVMTFRHVWPFRKNTAGIRVLFAGIGWETSTELSTTQPSSGRLPMQAETSSFALSRKTGCWDTYKTVYSNGPILYRYLVIGSLVATSKGKASMRSVNRERGARGWRRVPGARNETDSSFLCAVCQTESAQSNCF